MDGLLAYGQSIEAMKNIDIRTVDPATLIDLGDVVINKDLPKQERIMDYIRQIGNPYCYKCGKIAVKVGFSNTDITLDDRMESYLRTL